MTAGRLAMVSIVIGLGVVLAVGACSNGGGGGGGPGDEGGSGGSDGASVPDLVEGDGAEDLAPEAIGDERGADVGPQPNLSARKIVGAEELVPGPYARGRVGDFRLENDFLVAIVSADRGKWGPFGGAVIDLAPAGGEDRFHELFPIAGFLRAVRPDSFTIMDDGANGQAWLRMTGSDGPVPIIEAAVKSQPLKLQVTVDYLLETDSRSLEIRTTVVNGSDKMIKVPLGDSLVFSDEGLLFGAGVGFDQQALLGQQDMEFFGSDSRDGSYLLVPEPAATMSLALLVDEMSPVLYGFVELEPGASHSVSRRLYPAAGRSAGVIATYRKELGFAHGGVGGQVGIATPGFDFDQTMVLFERDGLFAGTVEPGAEGAFAAELLPGKYQATMRTDRQYGALAMPALPVAVAVEVTAGAESPVALDPEDPGRLDCRVRGPGGAMIPGRVTILAGHQAPSTAARVAFWPDDQGEATFFLAPGNYTMVGSRGPFWSICQVDATVVAGKAEAVECEIAPEVDLEGWMGGDLHSHSELGIDSTLPRELRVNAMLAEGLDLFATTDHDIFTDYAAFVAGAGLDQLIMPVMGNEVSALWGHFNCIGCAGELELYLAASWMAFGEDGELVGSLTAPQIWKRLHEEFGAAVVQINHPREGTGYLNHVKYSPELGPESVAPEKFDVTFDAIEVWNANQDWEHLKNHTLPDWYSLLNRGVARIATGNSDSHGLSQWAGQPRNLVPTTDFTQGSYLDALKSLNGQVTSAPFIVLAVDGVGPGATVIPDDGETVMLAIAVHAASWVPLDKVMVVVNGEVVKEWPVAPGSEVLRFEIEEELSLAEDSWLHVIALAEGQRLHPLYPGRTSMAFTQPVWIDLAGDGFDPPLGQWE